MAIFYIDSLAHYTTKAQADTKVAWTNAPTASAGAFSAPAVWPPSDSSGHHVNFVGTATVVLSAYIFPTVTTHAAGKMVQWLDGTGIQSTLMLHTDGMIRLMRGDYNGTAIASSAADVVDFGEQHHILVEFVCDNAVGSILVKIDGVIVLNVGSLDTQTQATAPVTNIRLWGAGASNLANIYWSHLALGSTAGEITGQPRVEALFPDGAGNYSQWNRSAGATQYTQVDETTPNDDTDYNYESTLSDRDSYTYSNMLGTAAVILAVALVPRVRKDDAAARTIKRFVRAGGTDYDGTAVAVPATYSYLQEVLQTNPATAAAWTPAEVNAIEAGIKVES